MGRDIRCFDYVNHPYARVRDALVEDAVGIFHDATHSAALRGRSLASELRANIAGIEIGTDVAVSVKGVVEQPGEVTSHPVTRLQLEWKAAKTPHLFPFMKAELVVYPLTSTETQLDLEGTYQPPLGALGDAINALAGHRIADASVHRFLADVAAHLRRRLTG